MEKTEKGRGDFADDVHPERSVDLGQNYQSTHFSKDIQQMNFQQPIQYYIQPIQVVELSSCATLNGYGAQSQRDNNNIGNEFQPEISSFNQLNYAQPVPQAGFNSNNNNNNHNNNNYQNHLIKDGYIHRGNNQLIQSANAYEESITNSSIADERRNNYQDGFSLPPLPVNANGFRLEMKAQKHIHSMTEKKVYQEKEIRWMIDQDAQEQMDQDCMSECSPQLIPKFTYCVNMPQNLPREQSYEALKNANRQKFNLLTAAADKLDSTSAVVVNYKNFLAESYKLAQEKPEECAHLLMTLETQFDLILHVSKPLQQKEYSKIRKPQLEQLSEQDDDVN